MHRRDYLRKGGTALIAASIIGFTGCTQKNDRANQQVVRNNSKFSLSSTDTWWSGTDFEYKGAYVLHGVLTNTSNQSAPLPQVSAIFYSEKRQLGEIEARFYWKGDLLRVDSESLPKTIGPDEQLEFRIIFETESDVSRYRVFVQ
jgi:hypothetical protein